MTELSALWLPILLGAVFCFIASSIIHMAPLWHKNEYPQLPDEEKARAAIGALNVPPGDYMLPRCKIDEGDGLGRIQGEAAPGSEVDHHRAAARRTRHGGEPGSTGSCSSCWCCVFAAYVSSHALAPGAHYHEVFRFIGATAFMGFALGADAAVHLVSARVGHHAQADVRRADLRLPRRRHVRVAVAESYRDVKWGQAPIF